MVSGEIQGFAGDITVLSGWIQENPDYQLLPTIFGGYPLAIALPKGRQYQELRDKVNEVVRKLKQEGWLEERAKYWDLPTN
jgi:polar amino acid transport system substrate-binding protein